MDTFSSTELNKSPAKIFRTVDLEGSVRINHDRYPDKIFILSAKKRGEESPDERFEDIVNTAKIMDALEVPSEDRAIIDPLYGEEETTG